jgi:hypothetical protein
MVDFKTERIINKTIDGKFFNLTVFAFVNKLPKCANCDIEINDNENCIFCQLAKKFFCYNCNSKDAFICNKFFGAFQNHSDDLVKIKLKSV